MSKLTADQVAIKMMRSLKAAEAAYEKLKEDVKTFEQIKFEDFSTKILRDVFDEFETADGDIAECFCGIHSDLEAELDERENSRQVILQKNGKSRIVSNDYKLKHGEKLLAALDPDVDHESVD